MTSILRSKFALSALAIVTIVAVAIVVLGRSDAHSTKVDLAASASSESTTADTAWNGATAGAQALQAAADAAATPSGPFTTPGMPLTSKVSTAEKRSNGDAVHVHVDAAAGSSIFGAEARLCTGSASIAFDGQFRPTVGGLCVDNPLSAASDSYLQVEALAPFRSVDLDFRVGTGSRTFRNQQGGQSTVTCDASNPCQIVLKLQYPNGFGFLGVPVTFR